MLFPTRMINGHTLENDITLTKTDLSLEMLITPVILTNPLALRHKQRWIIKKIKPIKE